jgi:hypothetical protein
MEPLCQRLGLPKIELALARQDTFHHDGRFRDDALNPPETSSFPDFPARNSRFLALSGTLGTGSKPAFSPF